MDRSQLVTIAVTALISVTAKEVITWLVSLAKSQVRKETTKAKARKIFNKNSFAVVWSTAAISISVYFLVSDIRRNSPISGIDVFLISFWWSMVTYHGFFFLVHLAQAIKDYKSAPNA